MQENLGKSINLAHQIDGPAVGGTGQGSDRETGQAGQRCREGVQHTSVAKDFCGLHDGPDSALGFLAASCQ